MPHIDLRKTASLFTPHFRPLVFDEARWLVCMGGAGSGKSVFAAQKLLLRHLQEPGHKTGIFRKVARTQRLSTFALMRDTIRKWGVWELFHINRSDLQISAKFNDNEMHFLGLDDPEKIKSIQGMTDTWIEEATELTQEDIEQINLRVRGETAHYKQHILTFNPISVRHWLKQRFWDERPNNAHVHESTYRDNPYLDKDYTTELELLLERDPSLGAIYTQGQWGELKGLIYGEWPIIDTMPEHTDEVIYGLDFGYNNPTALIRIAIKDQTPYIEQVIYKTGLTTSDLIHIMRRSERIPTHAIIYADAAEPDRIEEIARAGYTHIMPADKGQGSVQAGISTVRACAPRIVRGSVDVIKELQTYKWREDRDGNVTDEPVKYADHAMDAIRYALHSHSMHPTNDKVHIL